MLQDRSLLLVQQEHRIQMLIDTIMTMFSIEMIEEFQGGDNEGTGDYVNFEQWRINVDSIVAHIEDQGCYEELNVADQELIVKEIGMFVMELVISLQDVKVKRDDKNRPFDSNAPPVLHAQLIKLRTGVFIWEVLDPFHAHISKF
jgi:hypothetical protein